MKQESEYAPVRQVTFIATDLSTGGGVNKVIRDLAVLFMKHLSVEVTVVNARSELPSFYSFPPDMPMRSHRRQSLASYFGLLWRLRRSRPEIVISSWTQDNILATLAFLLSPTRTVLVEHSSWQFHPPAIRLLRRIIYPLAWRLIVLNRRDLEYYRRYLPGVRLIPNPVIEPTAEHPGGREKLILAVGHLEPLKNFEDAIRAMASSGLEDDGWSLAIIGSGSREPQLLQLIDALGLKRTRIHPPTADLASWYTRASILLLTSRTESFSLVLTEAMLAGVVPIAYASDGPSFILEDFQEQLVETGDIQSLTEQLVRLANEPGLESLRSELKSSVEARFSPDVVVEQWRTLLT